MKARSSLMLTQNSEEPGALDRTFAWQISPEESANCQLVDAAPRPASQADARVAERIEQALRATGYQSLRDVEIFVADGLVVLRGKLPSYYMKQVTQAAVRAVRGVRGVRDELDVVSVRSVSR